MGEDSQGRVVRRGDAIPVTVEIRCPFCDALAEPDGRTCSARCFAARKADEGGARDVRQG